MVNQSLSLKNPNNIKKSNGEAFKLLIIPFVCFFILFITYDQNNVTYFLGQIFGAVFFAQSFILLHELGHRSFFKSHFLNSLFGHFFSLMVFIPYHNWLEIHDLHHKWTGWRDKDPTTEKTFSDRFSPLQEKIINFCWRYSIPIFTLGYRLGIYWKLEKLKRHLDSKSYQRCKVEMIFYISFYFITIMAFAKFYLAIIPALYISFMVTDILSLSQHSHILMRISNGEDVQALKYKDQMQYSRSLIFPAWFSRYILFNINFHEYHHAYPGLPCYNLDKVSAETLNSYRFIPWLRKVKSMNGVDFIFKSAETRDGF